jgi:hypothetical protein
MGFFTLETAQAQLCPGGNFGPWFLSDLPAASVILSVGKDLMPVANGNEVLRSG